MFLLGFGDVAGAAIFSVNSATDAGDLVPGDGSCATGAFVVINMFLVPECTFRAAIEEGNGLTGADTVDFTLAPLLGADRSAGTGRKAGAVAGGGLCRRHRA